MMGLASLDLLGVLGLPTSPYLHSWKYIVISILCFYLFFHCFEE